jgi:plasmid stability protein
MKNITLSLDDETAALARVQAAAHKMSVSRFVGEVLRQHLQAATTYDAAMHRFLGRAPVSLKPPGADWPSRDDLHDRTRLR